MFTPRPGLVLNLRFLICNGSVGFKLSSGTPTGIRLLKSSNVFTRQESRLGSISTQLFKLLANWFFWQFVICREAMRNGIVHFKSILFVCWGVKLDWCQQTKIKSWACQQHRYKVCHGLQPNNGYLFFIPKKNPVKSSYFTSWIRFNWTNFLI